MSARTFGDAPIDPGKHCESCGYVDSEFTHLLGWHTTGAASYGIIHGRPNRLHPRIAAQVLDVEPFRDGTHVRLMLAVSGGAKPRPLQCVCWATFAAVAEVEPAFPPLAAAPPVALVGRDGMTAIVAKAVARRIQFRFIQVS